MSAHVKADPSRRPSAVERCSSCGHECGYHFVLSGRVIPCDADTGDGLARDCGCKQYTYSTEATP